MKRPLTLLFTTSLLLTTYGQDVQKCCGSSSSTFLLGSTSYARHTQCLYAPNDFTGAVAGQITRLYYRYGVSGITLGNTLGDLTISMVQTPATAFSGVEFLTGLQTVLETASFTIAPGESGDWFMIDLTTPFTYDPSQSLVVDISFETSENTAFGTMSTSGNTGRKIMWDQTGTTSGEAWDTLQDIGFDVGSVGMSERALTRTHLFPNPADRQADLFWAAPLEEHAQITLTDLTGRNVLVAQVPAGSTNTSIPVDGLSTGIYVLHLRDGSGLLFAERLVRE
ncbi:MAG: T9SS type A sorting domain-containing protein [Flavobacteriales bacterium]|nr:T9SS type A sorting domain-containing protein [Flavobacteriales bacterium]